MTNFFSNGEVIGGRYTISKFLDAGGMQEVYVAHDNVLNMQVALKTPKNHHADKRFKRSAVLSAKVNHPNVAKILDYLEFKKFSVLIEELIPGVSLNKALDSDFLYFDPYLLAQFGHHVAKGIAASHHAKVVHRDLKPGNIMASFINNYYSFKITDFGIATLAKEELKEAHKDELTIQRSQTMMGAIPYMAPEMIRNPNDADYASDIWAFGAILYRLMTGNFPFGVGIAAIENIVKANYSTDFKAFNLSQFEWLINEIWEIIKKCLSLNVIDRPTADDLVLIFNNLCYSVLPRIESSIQNFRNGTGDWGFICGDPQNYFFHRESFYGSTDKIIPGQRVQIGVHYNTNRIHPCLPLMDS